MNFLIKSLAVGVLSICCSIVYVWAQEQTTLDTEEINYKFTYDDPADGGEWKRWTNAHAGSQQASYDYDTSFTTDENGLDNKGHP